MPAQAAPATDRRLVLFLRWTVLLLSAGYTFLDYWGYNRMFRDDPREWAGLLAGQGIAPAQYRVGVLHAANALAHLLHVQLRHAVALIDFACLLAGLAAVLLLLTRTAFFRRAGATTQWTAALLALGIFELYLGWTLWFQKPETMATFAFLALSALLTFGVPRLHPAAASLLLLALAVAQATVRADAAVAFHLGILIACMLPSAGGVWLGRGLQAAISVVSVAAAVAIQYGIAHWLYPQAQRNVNTFQLLTNLHSVLGYAAIVLSLAPYGLTLYLALRQWSSGTRGSSAAVSAGPVPGSLDPWACGLLFGSLIHFAMFFTVGMADEVRIFLPYAMAVLPITVPLFCRALLPASLSSGAA